MIFKQNKKNLIFILFNFFYALALNACFVLLEHQWVFESSVIDAYELSSVWKDVHTDIVGKGSNTQKCKKTKEFVGAEGFFEEQLTV